MASTAMQRSRVTAIRLLLQHRELSSLPASHSYGLTNASYSGNTPTLQHEHGSVVLGWRSFSGTRAESHKENWKGYGRGCSLRNIRKRLEQHRRSYGASSSSTNTSGSDVGTIASQMIGYAATSRKNVESHVEVSRVLEQGYNFLLSQGPPASDAAGKVLLTLATLHVDGGKLLDAVDVLQQVANLEGVSAEVRVSANQALVGVFLRMHKDLDACSQASLTAEIVNEAGGLPLELSQELQFRAAATVQFVEHASGSKTSGSLINMSGLSSWLNHKAAQLDGVAAALLGIAECAHIRGHFSQAKDLYEKASVLAESSLERGVSGLSAGAMTAEDVLVGAEAGLGQVATHLGDFDDAEAKLTKALTHAEHINGEKHPRVGAVLACLAHVYAQRGLVKGTGDITLAEGLYRRATELLRAPPLDIPAPVDDVDLSDVMAISRARYAALLSCANKRETEVQKLNTWASTAWRGVSSLADVLSQEASMQPTANIVDSEFVQDSYTGRYVVIDIRLGRVLYSPLNI